MTLRKSLLPSLLLLASLQQGALGLLMVSFAVTLGALLLMFSNRFLLQAWVQQHFDQRLLVQHLHVWRWQ